MTITHDEDEGEHTHNHAGSGSQAWSFACRHHPADPTRPWRPAPASSRSKLSLVVLLVTALFQLGVALRSGSVALLADTIHNFADALTAIPLWLAFSLSRRLRNARYTYGYGRAEDLAGAAIVALIFFSALEVYSQSIQKIIHPVAVSNLGWVAAAAGLGFLGNELAAILRLRAGRRIHSAALVADGRHSQVDGFTSLGVLAGVIGVRLGFPLADPLVGFVIGTTILVVAWNSGRELWYRLMDATDPEVTRLVEQTAAEGRRGAGGGGYPHPLAGALAALRTAYHGGGAAPDPGKPPDRRERPACPVPCAAVTAGNQRARGPAGESARLGACADRPSYGINLKNIQTKGTKRTKFHEGKIF